MNEIFPHMAGFGTSLLHFKKADNFRIALIDATLRSKYGFMLLCMVKF